MNVSTTGWAKFLAAGIFLFLSSGCGGKASRSNGNGMGAGAGGYDGADLSEGSPSGSVVQFGDLGLGGQSLLSAAGSGDGEGGASSVSSSLLQEQNWRALYASNDHLWAVSSNGYVLSWAKNEWPLDETNSSLTRISNSALTGVWAVDETNVFVVSEVGEILHKDGLNWYRFGAPTRPGQYPLWGVWGSSGSDVWVVGGSYAVLHFDGSLWTEDYIGSIDPYAMSSFSLFPPPQPTPTASDISVDITSHVLGTSASDVLVSTADGLWHFDGTAWSPVDETSGAHWLDIFPGPNNVLWLTGWWSISGYGGGGGGIAMSTYLNGVRTDEFNQLKGGASAGANSNGALLGVFCTDSGNGLSLYSTKTPIEKNPWLPFMDTSSCVTDLWGDSDWTWAVGDSGLLMRFLTPQ